MSILNLSEEKPKKLKKRNPFADHSDFEREFLRKIFGEIFDNLSGGFRLPYTSTIIVCAKLLMHFPKVQVENFMRLVMKFDDSVRFNFSRAQAEMQTLTIGDLVPSMRWHIMERKFMQFLAEMHACEMMLGDPRWLVGNKDDEKAERSCADTSSQAVKILLEWQEQLNDEQEA
ncbi:MAG: hypothetical protein WC471_03050 [Candidatus Woesearchaeota archaeon]